ncbi:condensation domain-containing protein [Vibrio splendidus]
MSTQKLTQIYLPYGSVIVDKGLRLGNVSSLSAQELQTRYDNRVEEPHSCGLSEEKYPVSNPTICSMYTESVELGLSGAYNIPLVFSAKQECLEKLLERLGVFFKQNELYRYCLHREQDVIVFQEYTKTLNVEVKVYNESSLAALRHRMHSLILKPFNFERQPLFAVYRIKASETGDDIVLIVFHHTIIDGEGINQLRSQLTSDRSSAAIPMSEYIALSQRVYQYDVNSIKQYVEKLIYDERAAAHLQWEPSRWTKHRYMLPSNTRQSLINLCREGQSTMFARLLSLAAFSFKATFPQRQSVVVMIPYSNRESAQAMSISGCLINSVLIQIEFASLEDSLTTGKLLETIRSCAAFPLHEVMLQSRMQPDIMFVHNVHAHPFDCDLDEAIYNLKSVYPSSIEIREFSDRVDVLLGSDGQVCTEALVHHFSQCLEGEGVLPIWPELSPKLPMAHNDVTSLNDESSLSETLVENLKAVLANSLDLGDSHSLCELSQETDLFLWGLNSIKGIRFSRALSDHYSVAFSLRTLLKLRSLNNVGHHIVESGGSESAGVA